MIATPEPGAAVLAAQQSLWRALLRRDTDALQALLDEDLSYVHSTGLVHDRSGYLAYVAQGPTFLAAGLADPRLTLAGDLALFEGRLELTLQRAQEPQPQSLAAWATQVWRAGAAGWRLRRAQTTRIA